MKRAAGNPSAVHAADVAAVEAVLRDWIGLDATTIGTAAVERAIRTRMTAAGVLFEEAPRVEPYGTVAVWRDPFGNRWDLIERC